MAKRNNKMICRGCLSDKQELLNSLLDNPKLMELYTSCTHLRINYSDPLPKNLCSTCVNKCFSWNSFKEMCTINESVLVGQLNEQKSIENPIEMLQTKMSDDKIMAVVDQVNIFLNNSTETLKMGFEEVTIKNEILSSDEFGLQVEIPNNNDKIHVIDAEISLDSWNCDQTTENIYSDEASSIKEVQLNEINNPPKVNILNECDEKKIQTPELLKIHKKKTKPVKLDCSNCGRTFLTNINRVRHERKKICQLECSVCGEIFKTISELKSHGLIKHSSAFPHKCDICKRGFTTKFQLTRHLLTHNSDKMIQCEKCNKMCTSKSALKLHLKTHVETSNMCSICGETLSSRRKLSFHINKHKEETVFECDICDKRVTSIYQIRNHMTIHTGEKPFACTVCDQTFRHRSSLKYHMISHKADQWPFKCTECDASFKVSAMLKSHKLHHTGERPYKCQLCCRAFRCSNNLIQHKKIHLTVMPYKCDFCDRQFHRKDNLAVHTRTHTGEKPQKPKCTICEKKFDFKHQLRMHMECHIDEKPFNCTNCVKSFSIEENFKLHMKVHKPTPCSICNYTFESKIILAQHMKEVHRKPTPKKNKEYSKQKIECPICKKLIKIASKFLHMKSHSERTIKCELCPWLFKTKYSLKQHMLSHSNDHPLKCEYCEKSFKKQSDRTEHTRLHTGQAPTCKLCNKVYTHKADLIIHMRSHTGEKPYECTACDIAFDSQAKFKKHLDKHKSEQQNI